MGPTPYGFREDRRMRGRTGVGSGVASPRRTDPAVRHPPIGSSVLDIAYLAGALALFVIVGLIGKAVEKL